MQTPGTYISATGHIALIGWLLFGWGFNSEPLKFDTMDVSVISGEAFDEMVAARADLPSDATPVTPLQPVVDDAAPAPPVIEQAPEPAPLPDPVEQPIIELPPPPPPAPLVTDATDTPPVVPDVPESLPSSPNVDITAPPAPTQADVIASTPSAPPPPDAEDDPTVRPEVVPDQTAPPIVVTEEVRPTAPEETATEIALENVKPSGLVETSLRPVARPSRPTPPAPAPDTPEPSTEVATPAPDTMTPTPAEPEVDAVAQALAEAAASAAAAPTAAVAGPPMTGSERDSFRVSVNRCWNVDPGSVASRVTVEVAFDLDQSGQVVGQPRLVSSQGDQSAVATAFEAARRAILRCQSGGYQLPADKYDQWKEVVITFDPSGMRLR